MQIEISEGINSILIVEDEPMLSVLMETIALEMGVKDVHTASTLDDALDKAGSLDIDLAVLDLRLRDAESHAVSDKLAERDIPFVFCSGSDLASIPDRHRGRPLLSKPFSDDELRLIIVDTHLLSRQERRSLDN